MWFRTVAKMAPSSYWRHYMGFGTAAFIQSLYLKDNDVILIYNRVPKTGSTSFAGIAYDLCTLNRFHVIHVNISRNQRVLGLSDQ
ncbi:Heparan sulfate 2-O-sulfotransferase 1, partial [Bulinus truncatus]